MPFKYNPHTDELDYYEDLNNVKVITFVGATTENQIKMPDNLADALSFLEDSNKYLTFITTDDEEDVLFSKPVDIHHTAIAADDHALEIDVDAAMLGDIKAIDIDYITGRIDIGQDEGVILVNIDETLAVGGEVFGLEVLATDGGANIHGMKVGPVVGPIHQDSGTFANPTLATNNTPTTDVEAMGDGDIGDTTAIFVSNSDYIIVGAAAAFQDMELIFATPAGKNIKPTFSYSKSGGTGWTDFTPVDGTDGCKHTGVISWDASDLTGHVVGGATGTFDIRITRTRNNIGTTPVLGYAKTAATTEYVWDKDGNVNIKSLLVAGNIDFANYKAVAMVMDNGATLPSTVTVGQSPNGQEFLHTPTGRTVVMQFSTILSGTADTDSANKLVDSGAMFITDGVSVGDCVYNLTDGTSAIVAAVDSETSLSLDSDAFPDGDELYDVGKWNPKQSLGTFTAYVDKTDGTDTQNGGTAVDSDAFATVQFAINQIPPLYSGDVTININDETYNEEVSLKGKWPAGSYNIIIQGTLIEEASATQDSAVVGNGATQGSITDAGAFGSYDNLILYSSNNDEYRIIDSDTVNTATTVGIWTVAPTGVYTVYSWGTEIDSLIIGPNITVKVYDISFLSHNTSEGDGGNIDFFIGADIETHRCRFAVAASSFGLVGSSGKLTLYQCYIKVNGGSAYAVYLYGWAVAKAYRTKGDGGGQDSTGFRVQQAFLHFRYGSIADNFDNVQGGMNVEQNGVITFASKATQGYQRIRNCGTYGVRALTGGQAKSTANNQYSSNGTNEGAQGSSYAYID